MLDRESEKKQQKEKEMDARLKKLCGGTPELLPKIKKLVEGVDRAYGEQVDCIEDKA